VRSISCSRRKIAAGHFDAYVCDLKWLFTSRNAFGSPEIYSMADEALRLGDVRG